MLERVALHQTRLRVPGVGLDARGVALGARGLVLLPSLDRLVAFLAIYTADHGLDGVIGGLKIEVVRSKLGTREIALSFDAGSSDRLDRIGEVARLAGGFSFTGTTRHFVQYRDAAAPFGYDASEIAATDAALALYHATFTQTYDVEKQVDLKALLLRMSPNPDPGTEALDGPLWILAEPGLGPSVLSYFVRSGVRASAAVAEWPPATSFDDAPVRRWLFEVEDLPRRTWPLFASLPGVTVYRPVARGVAVEQGYRHPVSLRACPVFDEAGLLFMRGTAPPLELGRVPVLGDVRSLARVALADEGSSAALVAPGGGAAPEIRVPLRLLPGRAPPSAVAATLVPKHELGLLRRLVYALGADAVRTTRFAVTEIGAFLIRDRGIEAVPLGHFYRRVHPAVYVPSGLELVPSVDSDVLFSALGSPSGKIVFFRPDSNALAVDEAAFVPLENAILDATAWAPLDATAIEPLLTTETPTAWFSPLGLRPLKGADKA